MKKVSNLVRVGGLQSQKRSMYYCLQEIVQQSLGDPLLRKLDCKLR